MTLMKKTNPQLAAELADLKREVSDLRRAVELLALLVKQRAVEPPPQRPTTAPFDKPWEYPSPPPRLISSSVPKADGDFTIDSTHEYDGPEGRYTFKSAVHG